MSATSATSPSSMGSVPTPISDWRTSRLCAPRTSSSSRIFRISPCSRRSTCLPSLGNHDPNWEIVRDGSRKNRVSRGCIFNSFVALEGDYLDYFKRRVGHGRVYADGSVLYVCFGSQKALWTEQIEALAGGLKSSGVWFVWVVKIGPGLEEVVGQILNSFGARVGHRGRVVRGWAPQVLVLNHRGHCGWNLVMEAVVAGKMILGWPMEADQYVNARLLVNDEGVAFWVWESADAVPDPYELGQWWP